MSIYSVNILSIWLSVMLQSFATYGCFHPCFYLIYDTQHSLGEKPLEATVESTSSNYNASNMEAFLLLTILMISFNAWAFNKSNHENSTNK